MFRPSLVNQQGVHSCVQQIDLIVIFSMQLDLIIISIMCFGAVEMIIISNIVVYSCALPADGPVKAETFLS